MKYVVVIYLLGSSSVRASSKRIDWPSNGWLNSDYGFNFHWFVFSFSHSHSFDFVAITPASIRNPFLLPLVWERWWPWPKLKRRVSNVTEAWLLKDETRWTWIWYMNLLHKHFCCFCEYLITPSYVSSCLVWAEWWDRLWYK